jgi:MtN3 and saliva related transmembrane protein
VSSVILLATLIRRVCPQCKNHSLAGVARWLFVGQVSASVGFTICSLLASNRVYGTCTFAILIGVIAGEAVYDVTRERRRSLQSMSPQVLVQIASFKAVPR